MGGIDLSKYIKAPEPPEGDTSVDIPDVMQRNGKPQLAKRNNNPGNLRYAGQRGAVPGEGGFARFESPEEGYQALVQQVKVDQNRKLPLGAFIAKYAPPTENDTESYLNYLEKNLGVSRGSTIDKIDPDTLAKALAQRESQTKIVRRPVVQPSFDMNKYKMTPEQVTFKSRAESLLKFFSDPFGAGLAAAQAEPWKSEAWKNAAQHIWDLEQKGFKFINPIYASNVIAKEKWADKAYEVMHNTTAADLVGGLATGIISQAVSPLETITGVGVRDGEYYKLNPAEHEKAILETAGTIAMMGVAHGVREGLGPLARTVIGETAPEVLRDAALASKGVLRKAITKGAVEGALGGAAFGLVANADKPDAYADVMIQSLLFAPLGSAFELVGVRGTKKSIEEQAGKLAQLRMVQATSAKTFGDIAEQLDGLQDVKGIAQAALTTARLGDKPAIIPGLENPGEVIAAANKVLKGKRANPAFFQRPDGMWDMAIGDLSKNQRATFIETGYVPDQTVTVSGTDYRFKGLSKDKLRVKVQEPISGKEFVFNRDDVRVNQELAPTVIPENIHTRIFDDFENYIQTQWQKNHHAVQQGVLTDLGEQSQLFDRLITGTGTAGAGFDKSLIKKLGSNLYAGEKASIIVRELIQNSIDSVRGKFGKAGGGEIKFDARQLPDGNTTEITFSDNGTGMLPDVATSHLLDIGSSLKAEESAGGFGLAKVILFNAAKNIDIETTALNAEGRSVTTTIRGSGDDWIDGKLQVSSMQTLKPTGTIVKLQHVGVQDYDFNTAFTEMQQHSSIDDVVLQHENRYSNQKPIARDLVRSETLSDGTLVDIYISKDNALFGTTYHVMNTGMRQFKHTVFDDNPDLPAHIYFDVKPRSATDAPTYPFNTSRDALRGEAQQLYDKTQMEVAKLAQSKATKKLYESFVNAPQTKNGFKVIDPQKFDKDWLVHTIANRPYAEALTKNIDWALQLIAETLKDRKDFDVVQDFEFGGLMLDKRALAFNVNMQGIRDLIQQDPNLGAGAVGSVPRAARAIYFNPHMMVMEFGPNASELAGHTYGTLVHELAHNLASGHNEKYAGVLTRFLGVTSTVASDIINKLDTTWRSVLTDDFFDDHTNYESARPTADKIFKGHTAHLESDASGSASGGNEGFNSGNRPTENVGATGEGSSISSGRNVRGSTEEVGVSKTRDFSTLDNVEYSQLLEEFAQSRGYKKSELPELDEIISKGLHKKHGLNIDAPIAKAAIDAAKMTSEELAREALTNGMYVDNLGNGTLAIRDTANGGLLARASSVKEALAFVNKNGQYKGRDLFGGRMPPRLGSGLPVMSDGDRPNDIPFVVRGRSFMEHVSDSINSTLDWAVQAKKWAEAVDNRFGTQFYARVFDKLRVARAISGQASLPFLRKIEDVSKWGKNLSKIQLEHISNWLETMSPMEVMQRGAFGGKPLTPREIEIGRDFFHNDIDLQKVFQYRSSIMHVNDPFEIAAAQQLHGMDAKHLAAYNTVQSLENSTAMIGNIERYTRALQTGGLTRGEYAMKFGMNAAQLKVGAALDNLYKELATSFQIDPESQLQNYMTHARLYHAGDISAAVDYAFKNVPQAEKEFYAGLVRTGELSAYERNPIVAAQRYIKAGFDAKSGFNAAYSTAMKALGEEMAKLPDKANAGKIKDRIKQHLDDLRGLPNVHDNFASVAVNEVLNKLPGLGKVKIDVRNDLVRVLALTVNTAVQGFRVVAGMRDLVMGLGTHYMRLGAPRTARMLELATLGLDNVTKEELKAAGQLTELAALNIHTPSEFSATLLGGIASKLEVANAKLADKAFKLSGQKAVYDYLAYGTYLEAYDRASTQLLQLSRGNWKKGQVYENLMMDIYSPAATTEFDRLVTASKYQEAAQFLARKTVDMTLGTFGLGNHPRGWGRSIGILAGNLGGYSAWFRAEAFDSVSRGTMKHRIQAMGRMGLYSAAIAGASSAVGVNLNGWTVRNALTFGGGPIFNAVQTFNTAVGGYGGRQEAAKNQLLKMWKPFVPGAYFVNDLIEAFEMDQHGDPHAPLRALGLRPEGQ